MDFYSIILIIAAVVLVVALAGIGFAVTNGTSAAVFPSYINPCPDFWERKKNASGGYICTPNEQKQNVGGTNTPKPYTATGDICVDYGWAKTNNIWWDGISNNRQGPSCK